MASAGSRVVPVLVRVGDKEVLVTIIEEYRPGDNHGVPIHVVIAGPDGLTTEGKYPEAWQEMLELLGVGKPADSDRDSALGGEKAAVSTQHLALSQDEPAHSNRQSAPCQDERPETTIVEEGSPSVALTPPATTQNQNQTQTQNQNPAGAAVGPDVVEEQMERDEDLEEVDGEETDSDKEPELNKNIFRDSMLRLLNQRVYSDDPPLKIDEKMVAYIPYLHSTQEAANLIRHIEENIQLNEMKADASRRAANLNYLKKANRAKRCGHVKVNGQACGSPALRGQQYCHFHAQAHGASIDLPLIEDQQSLQLAYMKVAQQVASNKIDPAQARVLLQVLDKAGRGLPKSASMFEKRFPGI